MNQHQEPGHPDPAMSDHESDRATAPESDADLDAETVTEDLIEYFDEEGDERVESPASEASAPPPG